MISLDSASELVTAVFLISYFLYVETHFRIGRLPSFYFRRMPEILFDLPHRINPGSELPLLLLIKDADRFPIELAKLHITIKKMNKLIFRKELELDTRRVDQSLWWQLFTLPALAATGVVEVEPVLICRRNGRLVHICIDNYPTLSHAPLKVLLDSDELPGNKRWHYGDLHYHSHLTSDQVEFGAPPEIAAAMARAMGLEFLAVTDHSYDLDDCWEDYLSNDDALGKWEWLQTFVKDWNTEKKRPVILAGEELSAGNSRNRNVHFLLLEEPRFFPGWGDSAERWLRIRPQWTIRRILEELSEKSLSFASHGETRPPRLQRLFLGRDHWRLADYVHPRLTGVQMWNSLRDVSLERGIAVWRNLLLSGRQPVLIAGNDAHGDFGRWRQIAIPHVMLREGADHLFGQVRTGILRDEEKLSPDMLVRALRSGRCMVTNGPAAWIELVDCAHSRHSIGSSCSWPPDALAIQVDSSPAFGPLTSAVLCIGDLQEKKETRLPLSLKPSGLMHYRMEWSARTLPGRGYIRLEASSLCNGITYHCITNPIYLNWP